MNTHTLRRHLIGIGVLAAIVLLCTAGPAAAVTPSGAGPVGNGITLSAAMVNVIIGTLLPFVLGLAYKVTNPSWFKAVAGIVVAGIAAVIANATRADGTAVLSWAMALQFLTVYVPQIVSYLGLWKPLGESSRAGSFDAMLGPGIVPIGSPSTGP